MKKKAIVEGKKGIFMSLKSVNGLRELCNCLSAPVSTEPSDWWPNRCLKCPRLSPDTMCDGQRQQARLWSQPSDSLVSSLMWWNTNVLVKELHFPVTLSWREQGQEIYLKSLWEGHALFLKKNHFGSLLHSWNWVAARGKGAPSSSEGCTANPSSAFKFSAAPACRHWALLLLSSPISSGMPFPLSHRSWPDPQILLSQEVTSLPSATSPGSCKPERTAVSAACDCCKRCFQGCSEEAEKEVSWVLNSSQE